MIKAKINWDQVDESRLFEGRKGRYLDIVLIDSPQDNSDGFITQDSTKEEREAGVRMPIIGSFKRFDKPKGGKSQQPSRPAQPPRSQQQPQRPAKPATPFNRPVPPKDPDIDPDDDRSEVPF